MPVNFYPVSFIFLVPLFVFFLREKKLWRLIFGLGTVYYTNDYAGAILPDGETRLVDYENGDKNYGIFWGEIRY